MVLRRALSRLRPDAVIWPNESVPVRAPGQAIVIAQNLIYHCRDIAPLKTGSIPRRIRSRVQFAYYRAIMPVAYRRADAVVAVSRHAADQLSAHAGLDLAKVTVAHPGVDLLAPVVASRAVPKRLLLVGALAPYKRIEAAIDAAAAWLRAGNDCELVAAGEPWLGYGEQLDAYARRAGLGERWRRLGPLSDGLPELYASSHALLGLSSCESFGLPSLEAMRAGLPVIAADEPWSREMLRDAPLFVKPVSDSVQEALRALDDPNVWDRRSQAGREVAAEYTWARTAAGVARATRDALANR